jgi:hypothetical protein
METAPNQNSILAVNYKNMREFMRDLVENGLNSLRQAFAEQGIKYGKLGVELSGQSLDHSFYQHQSQQQNQQQGQQQNQQAWNSGKGYNDYLTGMESGNEMEDASINKSAGISGLNNVTYDYVV